MLIGSNGDKLGITPIKAAIEKAQDEELDLVQVSPAGSNPVVCKMMDYGKHVFAKKKAFHPQKQKLKENQLKKLNLDLLLM